MNSWPKVIGHFSLMGHTVEPIKLIYECMGCDTLGVGASTELCALISKRVNRKSLNFYYTNLHLRV